MQEVEKTKKKRKKNRENDHLKTDILERTPKMEKNFSFVNLMHPNCLSPLVFSAAKEEHREERHFNPCILQLGDHLMVSPSKMLNLSSPSKAAYPSPLPRSIFADHKPAPISKKLYFGANE